ncbi:MAG TPA: CoA pyrophosphatase [Acidimicrobiales bacterium]|nr:CoA pyrophosphatase [Acidimicrobiales bacterium]
MSRPVPPQVIPRPSTWRPGDPAPWAGLPETQRRGISVDRVLQALEAQGQLGPPPEDIGSDRVLGPTILVNEVHAPAVRFVNAAVLLLLFADDGEGEARLVFTRRSSSLRSHRGEVSFPGGRVDPGEAPTATALREAHEEVALNPALVQTAGWIHPVLTLVSGSLIMPIVATVPQRPHLVASPDEVERVFDVTLQALADPAIFHEERWSIPGRAIPDSPDNSFAVWFFEIEGEMIWGATARMIYELLSIVLLPAGDR